MLENFNRDVSAATRAADQGPVVITDRGEPAYVVLSIQEVYFSLLHYMKSDVPPEHCSGGTSDYI